MVVVVVVVVWGGWGVTYSFTPSLELYNEKNLGLLNHLKNGKFDCGILEGGGIYHLLHNFLEHPDVVGVYIYCSPSSASRGV